MAGHIHPEFLRLLCVLADKLTRNYYALIGAEEEIDSEAFTWSRARTFSFNKNSIGEAITYATAACLHLSAHSTVPPSRRQAGQPISSAACLMHSAAHAFQRTTPCPTPPHPAVDVDVGAPSIAPSAHANRAGASGEVDVVDQGTHAASGVAAAEWLAAALGGVNVVAGGTGALIAHTMTHRVMMMTTDQWTSSKQSLTRWVGVRTRAAMRMGRMSVWVLILMQL